MPEGPVIANNTPLVALWTLGRLDLLRDLYGTVWIPQAVYEEFVTTERAQRLSALREAPWIVTVSVSNPQHVRVYVGLDQGEAEVLALAEEHAARLVIVDEHKGRRYAQRLDSAHGHAGRASSGQRARLGRFMPVRRHSQSTS